MSMLKIFGTPQSRTRRTLWMAAEAGFRLWKSLAINLHLAKKHAPALYPKTLEGEARPGSVAGDLLAAAGRPADQADVRAGGEQVTNAD